MSCNCNSGVVLPTVSDDLAITTGVVQSCAPCEEGVCSVESEGSAVPSLWLDSCCSNEGVTLFGRFGTHLSHFTASGFLQLINGKASVVSAIQMRLTTLWHEFVKLSPTRKPIIGDPLPFNYLAVGDSEGNVQAIKGLSDQRSSPVYEDGTWKIVADSENPKCQKGLLDRSASIELVGYAAIAADGETDAVRCMKTLQGSGIPVLTSVATVDSECACEGCEPSPSFASIASVLANPESDGTYILKVEVVSGVATHAWVQD